MSQIELKEGEVKMLIKILRKYFINVYKLIYMLDQKQADTFKQKNTYYYQQEQEQNSNKKKHHNHNHEDQKSGCCGSFFSRVYIPEKERSGLEQVVCEVFRPSNLKDLLPSLVDFLQVKFNKIKKSGEKDKLSWNSEAEVYVLNEVMREGVSFFFQSEIKKIMQKDQYIDSKQPMLVATPRTWELKHPSIPLEFLSQDFIESLMKKGYGVQTSFIRNIEFARMFYKECDYLERDGRFEEPLQEGNIREDKVLWVTLTDIEKQSFKNIYFIAHILSALPYELNVKTQILAQISESFQISCFQSNKRVHHKHLDSSYDKTKDTGKKVSIFYIAIDPNDEKTNDDDQFQIYTEQEQISIQFSQDMMIGLMSRKIPFSIKTSGRKIFIIRFWIDGPYETRTNY